ncbi:PTS 2-O-a-mannosyl-D-glycerate transporter subunit IIABC [Bacillus sp. NEB1478]|uniref:PTS 2-O-a-mannosyl-D-glycerate transporter subunit IIABC n=1 Tax=Bacillus sp. NEB1478 TaxID=3073816 RepID=UPI0028738C66|nr:PTS 2-O-a-mannosyl-D-glycerate transporter subunit IIABC [Bacillus sp. NEB1478]WNB92651.1 PTS 2-O-a-mannosyl-D-glycerate transporter subunit IIABC [Bacillus sp. NEB1478]
MELSKLTSEELVILQASYKSKTEVITDLVQRLEQQGKITSADHFYKDVMKRESEGVTGMEKGLAIPHGKSSSVKEASFAVAVLENPLDDWESLDPSNRVNLVFLLAIPDGEAGSTHLTILSELSKRLVDDAYRERLVDSASSEEFLQNLDYEDKKENTNQKLNNRLMLAVTACPAGIAHTYMAAEALERAGRDQGIFVRVEKQGANGIEDPFTEEELESAEAVIFANDVQVKNADRFEALPILEASVAAPLKNAEKLIKDALALPKKTDDVKQKSTTKKVNQGKESVGQEIKQAVLTGISYIVPLIIAGGMLLAVSLFIAQAFDLQKQYDTAGTLLNLFRELGGGMLGTLMVPVLAAYISYSIADKPGLAPGFAAGLAASLINTGFVGGLLGGLVAGYLMKWMKNNIKTSGVFSGFVSFWVYPVFGTLIISALMFLVIGKPIVALNDALVGWLEGLSGSNAIILGAVLGIMASFDLGGPVNKAAYAFCIGVMADGNFLPYAAFASVKMVSAFTVTFATVLFKKYFEEYEIEVGKSTWILGLAGITEGAIPFMLKDPVRVIFSFVVGSAVTGAIVAYFGIGLPVPGAGIFSLFFLKGKALLTAMGIWFGAALIGTFISTTILVILKMQRHKKLQKQTA